PPCDALCLEPWMNIVAPRPTHVGSSLATSVSLTGGTAITNVGAAAVYDMGITVDEEGDSAPSTDAGGSKGTVPPVIGAQNCTPDPRSTSRNAPWSPTHREVGRLGGHLDSNHIIRDAEAK